MAALPWMISLDTAMARWMCLGTAQPLHSTACHAMPYHNNIGAVHEVGTLLFFFFFFFCSRAARALLRVHAALH